MTDFNDIEISKALSAPGACLSLSALEKFTNHKDGVFDLVHWYKLKTPYPRFKISKLNDEIIESMKTTPSLLNAVPYIDKAFAIGVKYLEFVPGDEEKLYSLAEVKNDSISENEINILIQSAIPEILTISFYKKDKQILLPRLFSDSWDVKTVLERYELKATWELYHLVCSIDAAYLEFNPATRFDDLEYSSECSNHLNWL